MGYSTLQPLASLLQADNSVPHEQVPEGVPYNYDWCYVPVVDNPLPPSTYVAANPWGQLYTSNLGNPYPGAKVAVRDLQAWVLSKATGQWAALYPAPPALTGAAFPENFQGSSVAANIDTTSEPGAIASSPVPGRLFHFYPSVARATINPSDVNGVVVVCRAKLVDDVPVPGLILNVGFDWWQDGSTQTAVKGTGEGRFKVVKRDWRAFTFTTLTVAQISAAHQAGTLPPISLSPGECF